MKFIYVNLTDRHEKFISLFSILSLALAILNREWWSVDPWSCSGFSSELQQLTVQPSDQGGRNDRIIPNQGSQALSIQWRVHSNEVRARSHLLRQRAHGRPGAWSSYDLQKMKGAGFLAFPLQFAAKFFEISTILCEDFQNCIFNFVFCICNTILIKVSQRKKKEESDKK